MNGLIQARMDKMLDEAQAQVPVVLAEIEKEFRERNDYLIPSNKLNIHYLYGTNSLNAEIHDKGMFAFTPFSENQVYSHFGIPKLYAEKLIEWNMTPLLEKNFKEINENKFIQTSVMLRTVNDKVKGWLSPSYKRIDASPVIGAFIDEAAKAGMIPTKAYNTDSRMQLRYIFPEVVVPAGIDNESCLIGISLTTSDYGGSAFRAEIYLIRLVCLNGMIGDVMFRQVHMGKRFDYNNDVQFLSNTTQRLDTMTMLSGVRDMTRALPQIRDKVKTKIEEAITKQPNAKIWGDIKRLTDKKVFEEIENAYNNKDEIELLPPMQSTWRLSNAISLVSQHQENNDKRIDLENLAMKFIA